ncbi:hypothetical protein AAG565_05135 [Fontimonas sp. SYSU GA230001]|uniref:hypothetical protein n=1 Tax=Fontimonas sp. SYSU GA230001 TaxID=3142450 RepID=UPI0032B4D82B
MTISIRLASLSSLVLLAGCAGSPRHENDPAFGSSVRQMIQAQIYNPAAAENPPAQAPDGIDGPRAENVLQTYRADVDKPARAHEAIQMQVAN